MVARAPRKRMYRTMQGRMIDIEKLRAANEDMRAVGNMNVNARGDVLGAGGAVVKKKEKVMRDYYETPKGKAVQRQILKTPPKPKMPTPATQTRQVETKVVNKPVQQSKPKAQTKTGIDAALDGIE